jgi:hypothetical protein
MIANAAALLPEADPARDRAYLAGLEQELAGWNARLITARGLPRRGSRSQRIAQRKRILVCQVRRRNIEHHLVAMRAGRTQFSRLRPRLQLIWDLFTAGIEQAES